MAARHCHSWWRWWSVTLWATLMRLWLHSLSCYLQLLLWRFLCNFIDLLDVIMFFCYWIPIVGKCKIPGWSGHTHWCSCSSAICQISWIKILPHFSLGPQGWFFFPLKKSTLTSFSHIQELIGSSILCASSGELFFWGKHLLSQTAYLLWTE